MEKKTVNSKIVSYGIAYGVIVDTETPYLLERLFCPGNKNRGTAFISYKSTGYQISWKPEINLARIPTYEIITYTSCSNLETIIWLSNLRR